MRANASINPHLFEKGPHEAALTNSSIVKAKKGFITAISLLNHQIRWSQTAFITANMKSRILVATDSATSQGTVVLPRKK